MCQVLHTKPTGLLRAWKLENGHLMIYTDPGRPGGGLWRHDCPSEEACGRMTETDVDNLAAQRSHEIIASQCGHYKVRSIVCI